MPEPAFAAFAGIKFFHYLKTRLHNGDKHQLRHAVADIDAKRIVTAIPAGNEKLPLIIRVDQANQVT